MGNPIVYAVSTEAIEEALQKIPTHIDRNNGTRVLTRIVSHSAFLNRSSPDWKNKRENAARTIQFNKAS